MALRSELLVLGPLRCARYDPKIKICPRELSNTVNCLETWIHTSFKLHRNPCLALDPSRLNAVVFRVNRDIHFMAALDDLEATIRHVGWINCEQYRQVLDVLEVFVCRAVEVRGEASRSCKSVVDCQAGQSSSSPSSCRYTHSLFSLNKIISSSASWPRIPSILLPLKSPLNCGW